MLRISLLIIFFIPANFLHAQISGAWTSSNGNIETNNSIGGIAFHKFESGNIVAEGGQCVEVENLFLLTEEILIEPSFSYYPNPTSGIIETDLPLGIQINIYNLQGVLLLCFNNRLIDLTDLSTGTYLLYAEGYKSSIVVKY